MLVVVRACIKSWNLGSHETCNKEFHWIRKIKILDYTKYSMNIYVSFEEKTAIEFCTFVKNLNNTYLIIITNPLAEHLFALFCLTFDNSQTLNWLSLEYVPWCWSVFYKMTLSTWFFLFLNFVLSHLKIKILLELSQSFYHWKNTFSTIFIFFYLNFSKKIR